MGRGSEGGMVQDRDHDALGRGATRTYARNRPRMIGPLKAAAFSFEAESGEPYN